MKIFFKKSKKTNNPLKIPQKTKINKKAKKMIFCKGKKD